MAEDNTASAHLLDARARADAEFAANFIWRVLGEMRDGTADVDRLHFYAERLVGELYKSDDPATDQALRQRKDELIFRGQKLPNVTPPHS
ncbi:MULTISPECIES: hypothetical protein [unclassified Sphingomonas]|uniref:hypothetical protein n=1 Tax=unclassified Sphingomonas TaxID=196159 RepID=UPI002269E58F|nr:MULTISPECIES: hypothetical protein [unclassified Sphingomonas]